MSAAPSDSLNLFPPLVVVEPSGSRDRLVQADCLDLMGRLPEGSVDLIYVDPPFATGRSRRVGRTDRQRSYPDTWDGGLGSYLPWLKDRLVQMRRLLAPTGSLFLHLDWRASHYAKVALDEIFGASGFRNEIVWHYSSGGRARRCFSRKHDVILWYSRTSRWRFFPEAVAVRRDRCPSCGAARKSWNHLRRHTDEDGRVYRTIKSAGKIYRYYDDEPVVPPDVWLDVGHLQQKDPERLGYPTQKPEALLRRVMAATTRPGDLVADLFCGSGTTLAVASGMGRSFLGCDIGAEAVEITRARLDRCGASFSVERLGLLPVTGEQIESAESFRRAVRQGLGALHGPRGQPLIHGMLELAGGRRCLWIPPPLPREPTSPEQVRRFLAAVDAWDAAAGALLLCWEREGAVGHGDLEPRSRRGLPLQVVPIRWSSQPGEGVAGTLQLLSPKDPR